MKVKDLIRLLQQLPQDHEVWYDTGEGFGEQAVHAYLGFVEDGRILWHDAEEFDEVEADEKYHVVIIA